MLGSLDKSRDRRRSRARKKPWEIYGRKPATSGKRFEKLREERGLRQTRRTMCEGEGTMLCGRRGPKDMEAKRPSHSSAKRKFLNAQPARVVGVSSLSSWVISCSSILSAPSSVVGAVASVVRLLLLLSLLDLWLPSTLPSRFSFFPEINGYE